MMFAGPDGFHPADIQAAYQMPANGGTKAIAIIDAYDDTTSLADFNTFASEFNLPLETSTTATAATNKVFQVVYATGTQPTADQGWSGEISLDIEWAHAMAPNAKIYLVEAADDGLDNLYAAETVAAQLLNVKECSNSWGAGEYGGETSTDSIFVQPGVVFFASAGDTGGAQSYPAESVNVVGVGGTSLQMNGTVVTSETAWNGSGGGPSAVEPRPSFQNIIQSIVGTARGCPDVAAIADPGTGVAVFGTFAFGGWAVIGGTSVACPVNAGIANNRGQFSASSAAELARIYKYYAGATYHRLYRDIVSGSAGSFNAGPGWDFITGVGCPTGLYPVSVTQPLLPTSISVLTGTLLSGDLASIYAADGNTYNVAAAEPTTLASGVGPAATVVVTFKLPLTNGPPNSLLTAITSSGPIGSTVQLFAYNWASKAYDIVQAFPGMGTSTTNTTTVGNLGTYMNSGGVVQYAIRTFIPSRANAAPFTTQIDAVVAQAQ
jgi:subtilase family serine protease